MQFVRAIVCAAALLPALVAVAQTPEAPALPTEEGAAELLAAEPFSLETWPAWRQRLLAWIGNDLSVTDSLFDASWEFVQSQADAEGRLTGELAGDSFAWYLLGSAQLAAGGEDLTEIGPRARRAHASIRRSLELDDSYARAHRRLAETLLFQPEAQPGTPLYAEGLQQLARARELDPELPTATVEARAAIAAQRWVEAVPLLQQTLVEEPTEEWAAAALANATLMNLPENLTAADAQEAAATIATHVERFPENDPLRCMYAVSLAQAGQFGAAAAQLDVVRARGGDPVSILSADMVSQIDKLARPGFWKLAGSVAAVFVAVYAVVAAAMALTGLMLARFTRGDRAVSLLGDAASLIEHGRVARTQGESLMARLYGMSLMGGLLMFYVAIPFVVGGLVVATVGAIYGVLMLPQIPIKLLVIIAVVGFGMAWVVLKSLFARSTGASGLPLAKGEHPRLRAVVEDVATAVNTAPVDKIFMAPGAEIGVHQDGRGPFGMFGVKDRVLTLGMASLQHLNVDQLRSILAHEYAHFSHGDTRYSRFIHQVTSSIQHSLAGMGATAGQLNYVNPFYWFLYLYYRAYSMMAAGFSRSREFLADRMAVSLYGRDVFESALTAVATKASVAHGRIFRGVISDLELNKYVPNAYEAHRLVPDGAAAAELNKVREEVLGEQGTLFASHPTMTERFQAIAEFPTADRADARPARELLDEPEAVEQELTKMVTAFFHDLRQLQMSAS